VSWFENLSLRLLCLLGVSAVDLPVKRVHCGDAEKAQRVEIRTLPEI
jgi:hypothetical protein